MTANKKIKIHFSTLRHQIAGLFILTILVSIISMAIINSLFLKQFYLKQKIEVLCEARDALSGMDLAELMTGDELTDGTVYDPSSGENSENPTETAGNSEMMGKRGRPKLFGGQDDLNRKSTKNNLSFVIINQENSLAYSWGESENMLRNKLFGYIYNLDTDKETGEILKENEKDVIQKVHDRFSGMDYVECWGQLDSGYYFLIRSPMESIEETAALSNRFFIFVGIIVMAISAAVIMVFVGRITRPISELTTLSRKMSSLDFEERYRSQVGNEIDVLGESFNKMSDELEKTISELKSANLQLQKDIENKIRMEERRTEFLNNVSHELKTPIALIQGYAEGLKEGISDDPDSMDFYCEVIMDEAAKMNTLVKNLLTLNQLESGNDAVTMERFDLTALTKGVLGSMDILIQQNEAIVIFEEEDPVYVWADEFKIEEVLTNYISNALHHLGGERHVEIRILKEEDRIKLTVFNNGSAVPEEDIPNLWGKFYKVDKARTREYGGSGIGLSIVKAIMESHKQEYGVENVPKGVVFWFTLEKA